MTYDVDEGPPKTVEVQEYIEETIEEARELIPFRRVAIGLAILWIGYLAYTGDSSSPSQSFQITVTPELLGWIAGAIVAYAIVTIIITVLHELAHWYALHHFGIPARWTLNFAEVKGYPILLMPTGGLTYPVDRIEWSSMTLLEDAIVSLAPMTLSAVIAAPVVAYHVFVAPFDYIWIMLAGILVMTGPSFPDYRSIFRSPRSRWEVYSGFKQAVRRHASAEGIHYE
jgi:hypothetical protein